MLRAFSEIKVNGLELLFDLVRGIRNGNPRGQKKAKAARIRCLHTTI
jgi:hypothetical protein